MKIAYYYPSQSSVPKDIQFLKYSNNQYLHNNCSDDVDVVYAASVSVIDIAHRAAVKYSKPLICWCWDVPITWREWEYKEHTTKLINRDKRNKHIFDMLRKCDHVISACKFTQDVLANHGIPSYQMYHTITDEIINTVPKKDKRDIVIHMSRFKPNKRQLHSIYAMKDIKDTTLVFTGTGHTDEMIKLANEYKVDIEIHQGIKYTDAISLLKQARLLLSPSMHEGFGYPVIEALYCDIPVLISDNPTYREIYGEDMLYHTRNNREDMKIKLELLLNDSSLQNHVMQIGKKSINSFTTAKFAKRWDEYIRSII